jgi:LysR family transcriptional regulator, glycine cleavage system transcriptional activator
MRRILPSLGALEAFEAVSRLGSVTLAANELYRTQSAISRQIANLEQFAKRPLFIREQKRLVLNEAGKFFIKSITRILTDLEVETARLVAFGSEDRILRLGVLPTLGSHWLMPRLASFSSEGDQIELHIVKGLGRLDFERLRVDAAFECSIEAPPDLYCHHLLNEEIVAVIAPGLYAKNRGAAAHVTKLHMPARPEPWDTWMSCHDKPKIGSALGFENYGMLIEAACLGFGVAILPAIYLSKELTSKRLITPFGPPISSGRSYWLTYPETDQAKRKVSKFVDWMLASLKEGKGEPNLKAKR